MRDANPWKRRSDEIGLNPGPIFTKNCWQNYVDYFKCVANKGEEYAPCNQFKSVYKTLCPIKWIEQWDEQREEGTFPALYVVKNKPHSGEHH
ncbi:Cytochrome c oxidase subunit 6B [Podochytrium sp. JEL0797]|nr:Cytochrome c oxidase subunit 6B [Podochytrium sp. JEL0797]